MTLSYLSRDDQYHLVVFLTVVIVLCRLNFEGYHGLHFESRYLGEQFPIPETRGCCFCYLIFPTKSAEFCLNKESLFHAFHATRDKNLLTLRKWSCLPTFLSDAGFTTTDLAPFSSAVSAKSRTVAAGGNTEGSNIEISNPYIRISDCFTGGKHPVSELERGWKIQKLLRAT